MTLSIKHINPPQDLEKSILLVIAKKERFSMILQASFSVLSFVAFFPIVATLIENFSNSSISQYFSILFSGDGAIGSYWQELTLSILESIPVLTVALFLTVSVVFLYSVTRAIKNGRQFLSLKITA